MTVLNFPTSPTLNQIYVSSAGRSWRWDGLSWIPVGSNIPWDKISDTPTTLTGFGITNAQPLDADLTAIASLTGTNGLLRKTAVDTWSLDTNSYATSSGAVLTVPTLTGTRESRVALSTGAIDLTSANYFTRTISGALTFSVLNVPANGTAISFILDLTNGGSAVITWWSGVKWAGGTAPILTASGRDVLGFFTYDGGVTWTGLVLGKDVK
jgi:hypothetical protein